MEFAGAAVGATIQVLLQAILSKSIQEIIDMWGLEKDLTKLKNSLLMIQYFLYDAEAKSDNNRAVKHWLHNLENVAFEADSVLDEFNYQLLRLKVKNQNRKKKKVTDFFSSGSSRLIFRRRMAHKIRDVNTKLESINKEANNYGLTMAVVDAGRPDLVASVILAERQTDSFAVEPNFIERETDVSNIVETLVTDPTDEIFSVIPILGMGGLGKTTLARKIFNQETIKANFEERIWVCVTVQFDAVILWKMILESFTGENVQGMITREAVIEKIRQHLERKRYLLVLDDVWDDDSNNWNNFISSLSGISTEKRNGIIVTTRMASVASIIKPLPTRRLKELSESDCWSIIKSKALSTNDNHAEFEDIGKRIAQRCCGLPLAAKVIGGMLYGKSKDYWLSILSNQLSDFRRDESTVRKILKLSYDRLPSPTLKKCFAYCSVFPQDHIIGRMQLIELWIAEGFLQSDQGNDMEVVGDIYFNYLLQNSLLQEAERDDYGNVLHCKMHDLVHDVASSISGSRSAVVKHGGQNDMNEVRYVFVESLADKPEVMSLKQAQYLRTVFFEGQLADLVFLHFKCLHVLNLKGAHIAELPIVIEKLKHLRLLNISGTEINCLPVSVGKLYNLQTLRIHQCGTSRLKKLPDTIIDLISLRHLNISSIQLPPGIGKLTSLRTLPYYQVGRDKGCRIGELGELKHLRGELRIENLELVNDGEEAKHANLFEKANITKLSLWWNRQREGEINDENVLEGLQPHPNLKSLEIRGYKGGNFPLWTMRMAVQSDIHQGCQVGLNNLVKIILEGCEQCEDIPMLGHLPHLRRLGLIDLPNVHSIGLLFYGFENCSTSSMSSNVNSQEIVTAFPALENLVLRDMENLREWVGVEGTNKVFPCVTHLRIVKCPKLKSVPRNFPRLKNLHIQKMGVDFSLTETCSGLTSIKYLYIESLQGLISLPEWLFVNNPNLSLLYIKDCPKLTHIVPGLFGGGASMRKLKVTKCEKLRELPSDLNNLQSLEELWIWDCGELKTIPYLRGGGGGGIQDSQGLMSLRTFVNLQLP